MSVYYFTVDYYTEAGTRIGTLNASDADTGTYGQLVSYSLNQASLGDNYFGVTNGGELFSNMNMSGLGDSMTVSFTATVTDGGGKTDITTVNVQILGMLNPSERGYSLDVPTIFFSFVKTFAGVIGSCFHLKKF